VTPDLPLRFGREGVRYAVEEMTEPRVLFLKP
jgi:hypothetical protein